HRSDESLGPGPCVLELALALLPQLTIGVLPELVLPLLEEILRDVPDRVDPIVDLLRAVLAPLELVVQLVVFLFQRAAIDIDDGPNSFQRGLELFLRLGLCLARFPHPLDEDVPLLP